MKNLNEAIKELKHANATLYKGYKWHLCFIDNGFQLLTEDDLFISQFTKENIDILL